MKPSKKLQIRKASLTFEAEKDPGGWYSREVWVELCRRAAEAFKPRHCLEQKLLISLPCLRQETLLSGPDLFCFAYLIKQFFHTKIGEIDI